VLRRLRRGLLDDDHAGHHDDQHHRGRVAERRVSRRRSDVVGSAPLSSAARIAAPTSGTFRFTRRGKYRVDGSRSVALSSADDVGSTPPPPPPHPPRSAPPPPPPGVHQPYAPPYSTSNVLTQHSLAEWSPNAPCADVHSRVPSPLPMRSGRL
jgi:hypothetical protein